MHGLVYKLLFSMFLSISSLECVQTRLESFSTLDDFIRQICLHDLSNSLVALDLDDTLLGFDENGEPFALHPQTTQIICMLQAARCKVVGLTARHPKHAKITCQQLHKAGIDFSNNKSLYYSFGFGPHDLGLHTCCFFNNIIFAGKNEKGFVLQAFDDIMHSKCENWNIRNFFFLDNNKEWVNRFKKSFEALPDSEIFVLAGHFTPSHNNERSKLFENTRGKAHSILEAIFACFS